MKKLSELNGMRIYSDRANYVGSVEDTVIDDKEGIVIGLVFGRKAGKALSVPYSNIMAIGDIILVYSKKAEVGAPT
ncbi:MAG: PRC-barrel domain-containing protein [Hadesarchaea archaeon]|nr:PRC-barrel domain-containing protein [Hadesarchaea archaeon]